MSLPPLFLLLPLLLLSSLLPSLLHAQAILRRQADADWAARAESSAYRNAFPQSIHSDSSSERVLVPAGSLWVYGGVDIDDSAYSDVWVTTDSAKTWHRVGNVGADFTVQDAKRSADCFDHRTGRVYAISGTDVHTKELTSRVAASNDGAHWEMLTHTAEFPERERPACTVDSQGWVYIFGGETYSTVTGQAGPSNDIWRSSDLGYTWTRLTARAPWWQRISPDSQTHYSSHFAADVIYVANGDGGKSSTGKVLFQNDVWVSSDATRTWARVTAAAPYPYRKDSELTITRDGVLIITGGDDDLSDVNDVWASLDGGYTWGACCTKCGYETREDHMGILDPAGYLYVMGGDIATDDDTSRYEQDVWKSSFSFHDVAAVASMCKLSVPAAGAGLRCWPDGTGGGCTSTTSAGLSTVVVVGIIVLVLAALVVAFLGWRYYQKRAQATGQGLMQFGQINSSTGGSEAFLGTDRL